MLKGVEIMLLRGFISHRFSDAVTMINSFFQVAFLTNYFSLDMKHVSIDLPNDLDGLHTACKQRNSMCGLYTRATTNLVSVLSSTKHTVQ